MRIPVILGLGVLFSHMCFGQSGTTPISLLVENVIAKSGFEGTVLIAEQGNIIFQTSVGFSDRESQSLIQNDTRFGIASITKMLTAIVILQLVEEGELKLSDKVGDLLPETDLPKQNEISIHHLLLHITGLPNESDEIYSSSISPMEFINRVVDKKSTLEKFGNFNYANIDYLLLGLIIEKITQSSWQEAINKRIISKLNLNDTGFLAKNTYPDNFAFSYSVSQGGHLVRDPDIYIENYFSAGSMYSSAHDLLKIDQAMYGEILLSDKSKALMFTSYPEYNYTGYSVWTYHYPFSETNPKIMERRGGIMGYNAVLVRMLDTNKTIIILSNNDRFDPDSFGDKNNLREALIIELGKARK